MLFSPSLRVAFDIAFDGCALALCTRVRRSILMEPNTQSEWESERDWSPKDETKMNENERSIFDTLGIFVQKQEIEVIITQ